MKHNELLIFLKSFFNTTPKQKDIAQALNVNLNVISTRASRNYEYNIDEILQISNYLKIPKDNILQKIIQNFANKYSFDLSKMVNNSYENVRIARNNQNPYYIETYFFPNELGIVSNNSFCFSPNKQKIFILKSNVKKYNKNSDYIVISAFGEGMQPTITNNDILIVELFGSNSFIDDNEIYVFTYENKIFIRRIIQDINRFVLISDNTDKSLYPHLYINNIDYRYLNIIGKITGLMRTV